MAELTDEEFWVQFDAIMALSRTGQITKSEAVREIRRLTGEEA